MRIDIKNIIVFNIKSSLIVLAKDINAKMAMRNMCKLLSILPILKIDYTKMNILEKYQNV